MSEQLHFVITKIGSLIFYLFSKEKNQKASALLSGFGFHLLITLFNIWIVARPNPIIIHLLPCSFSFFRGENLLS